MVLPEKLKVEMRQFEISFEYTKVPPPPLRVTLSRMSGKTSGLKKMTNPLCMRCSKFCTYKRKVETQNVNIMKAANFTYKSSCRRVAFPPCNPDADQQFNFMCLPL